MAKKKTKVVEDINSFELHELYKKHEYHPISERNAIEFCVGCGTWAVHLDRENNMKDERNLVPLLPRDFGDTGPFKLWKVMNFLNPKQRLSLATYLKSKGYGSKNAKRKEEIAEYLEEEK